MDAPSRTSLEKLPIEDCMALLATVSVGRIGVSIAAVPAILPVNFALLHGQVVIRTVPGTKLDAAAHHHVVAFEADDFDHDGRWGWSVLIRGVASEITEPDALAEAAVLDLHPWVFSDDVADRFMRIESTLVSGRRFAIRPAVMAVVPRG